MENKNKIILPIVAIALVIAIVGGGTYAYWQWVTNTSQQTAVNVTVAEGINMTILPESANPITLYPTNVTTNPIENCTGTGEAIQCLPTNSAVMISSADITINNETGILARPRFMLKLRIMDGATNITNSNVTVPKNGKTKYRDYIHYAVAEGGESIVEGQNVYEGDCDNPIVTGTFAEWTDGNNDSNQIETTGWYNSPYITITNASGFPQTTGASISFPAFPYFITSHKYKVCIWVDPDYTYTNTGNDVSDPLQNAFVQVSWSEESEVIQVFE